MSVKVTLYRFKVSLAGWRAQPISKLHRIIELDGNAPFMVLHELIFEAFDRHEDHLFTFLLTREKVSGKEIPDCDEEVTFIDDFFDEFPSQRKKTVHDVLSYTIAEAGLKEKDAIYYWFDFGDDWLHRLYVEKIFTVEDDLPNEEGWLCRIASTVGTSPPQYSEDEECEEE